MVDSSFEGTLVLEKLAEVGRVEDFLDAVDSDDFDKAKQLMKEAEVDTESIKAALKMMGSV